MLLTCGITVAPLVSGHPGRATCSSWYLSCLVYIFISQWKIYQVYAAENIVVLVNIKVLFQQRVSTQNRNTVVFQKQYRYYTNTIFII